MPFVEGGEDGCGALSCPFKTMVKFIYHFFQAYDCAGLSCETVLNVPPASRTRPFVADFVP